MKKYLYAVRLKAVYGCTLKNNSYQAYIEKYRYGDDIKNYSYTGYEHDIVKIFENADAAIHYAEKVNHELIEDMQEYHYSCMRTKENEDMLDKCNDILKDMLERKTK